MNVRYRSIIRNLLSLIFITLFVVSCGGGKNSQKAAMMGRGRIQALPVLKVQRRSIVLKTSYPTTLKGAQTVEIRPRVSGYITKKPVHEGDFVHKGEVLFQLQKSQFQQQVRSAKANVQAAKAGVQTAKDNVKRLRSLVQQNIISHYTLKSAVDDLQTQKAKLAQAKASLVNAKVNLSYTTIRSPVSGSIGNIPYRVGSLVSSSIAQPLTTVSDISTIYAYFSMTEQQLLQLSQKKTNAYIPEESQHSPQDDAPGKPKSIQERVAAMPNARLILSDSTIYNHTGRIQLASGQINTNTGSASLKAIFPNPNDLLRSGSTGEIVIPDSLHSVIVVPKKATYTIQDLRFVYVVSDSNTVKSTVIHTQPLSTKKLFVVKSGLPDGAVIVMAGMGQLRDGMKIKPRPVNADSLYQALTVKNKQKNKNMYGNSR
jgi:membrane fusion protein (multidrug efflux system)